MPDREKVIKGLECCKTYATCNKCPYNGEEQNCNSLRREALALIKEQQELIDEDKEELQKRCDELGKELNDAVELIHKRSKQIRATKPKRVKGYNPPMYTLYEFECEECKSPMMNKQPYCMGCGREVAWDG